MQAQDIVTAAFRELTLIWPGQTPSPDQLNEGFNALNRLLPLWNTQRAVIYAVSRFSNALTPDKQSYTIGTAGGADFDSTRPIAIRKANIITAAGSFGNALSLTDETILSRAGRSRQAQLPLELWYQASYPLGTLWLWPIPSTDCTLEIFLWQQLSQFVTLADTFDLPPGYELAIVKNLAVILAPMFMRPVSPDLARDAATTKLAISGVNAPPVAGMAEEMAGMSPVPAGGPSPQR